MSSVKTAEVYVNETNDNRPEVFMRLSCEDSSRRTLLTTLAGIPMLGAFISKANSAGTESGKTSLQEQANIDVVTSFCKAWSSRDLSKPFAFLAENCVYRMTETTPPANGHQGISDRLKSYVDASDSVEFHILNTFATGPIVVNHRIDTFESKTVPVTWEGVGVFFVKDSKILEWFDYTIRVLRSPQKPTNQD